VSARKPSPRQGFVRTSTLEPAVDANGKECACASPSHGGPDL